MDQLSHIEIHKLILEILTLERLVWVRDEEGVEHEFKFKYPSNSIRLEALHIEEKILQKSLDEGLFSEDKMPEEFVEQFFTSTDQERVQELDLKIKGYETLLLKRVKGTEKYDSDKESLEKLRQERRSLLSKKNVATQFSAEYKAREESQYYLLIKCCLNPKSDEVCWKSVDDLLECRPHFVNELLNNFIEFYWGPSLSKIREVARSSQWRNMYIASTKTGLPLFEGSAKSLSLPQMQLLSWSMQYQSIYELPYDERPSDDVINDDERFDKFVDEYYKKLKAEVAKSAKTKGSKKSMDDQHTIVTANSENYVKLHKADAYSDPSLITGRQSADGQTTYDEMKEVKEVRKKVKRAHHSVSNSLKRRPR